MLAKLLRPLINRLLPEGYRPVTVRSGPAQGIRVLSNLDTRSTTGPGGTHEPHVQQALSQLLKPGMTFWDVGAHIGLFSLLASRAVSERGAVHAFEPQPDNRSRLHETIKLNGATNVSVHDFALSDITTDALLHAHQSSTMWSLVREQSAEDGIHVQCKTLDSVAEVLDPPNVIKIDVEGAELNVLQGGRRLLAQHRPILLVEFSNGVLLEEARNLLPFYTFEHLGGNHWLAQ